MKDINWRVIRKTRRLCYIAIDGKNIVYWQPHLLGLNQSGKYDNYEYVVINEAQVVVT